MRTKSKIFVVSILILVQISCNDWMELLPPSGLIRENFWKTKEDVVSVLMAAYESFAQMDRYLFIHGEIRADMVAGDNSQSRQEELISEGNIYPDNNICNWNNFYSVINYCNEIITNAPTVLEIDRTFSEFQMQGLVSEAYFLRSLSYFYLVRVYKDVPLILEPSTTDVTDFFIEKSSEEEILNQIVSDLEEYRLFAPSGGFITIEHNKGRASKAAFDALLADIALWRFDYNAAINHIEKIEQTKEYILLPSSDWFRLFYPGNSFESILEFQFDGNRNQLNSTYSLTTRSRREYKAGAKAIELLSLDFSRELVRGEGASIRKYGDNDFSIWKYVGQSPDGRSARTGAEQYSCNWIVYRYADILLMKAEALSQLARYDEALTIINEVRGRANTPALSLANNRIVYEDAILDERARELAFEGKRWFDLLRMGRRNNYERKVNLIDIIVKNVPSTQRMILAAKLTNPLGWYIPIYDAEIERNWKLVQNPYYY